jgi:membrane AbrB-like protein
MAGRSSFGKWGVLVLVSVVFCAAFSALHLPAGTLLGCMLAGMVLSVRGFQLSVSPKLFVLGQGVLGCMIARSLQIPILLKVASDWPIFLGLSLCVMAASAGLGWLLMRSKILPGTTAIWGLAPGAASAMVLMAEDYGADVRLVAFMQYLRVAMVTAVASLVAHFWVHASVTAASVPHADWHLFVSPINLSVTLLIALGGATAARLLKITGGALLVPMVTGIATQNLGAVGLELPQWLLLGAYGLIGWSIGLRFSRSILDYAWRVLPKVLASILALIGIAALLAVALCVLGHFDPLTAYLATSPGGADSVAVIAATSAVDAGFVMAMQMMRFVMVLAFGPPLSRFLAMHQRKLPVWPRE